MFNYIIFRRLKAAFLWRIAALDGFEFEDGGCFSFSDASDFSEAGPFSF